MNTRLFAPKTRGHVVSRKPRNCALVTGLHPADLAAFVATLDEKAAWRALETCAPPLRAEIFSHLDGDLQVALSEPLSREELATLLTEMSPDDRVDLIQRLPAEKQSIVLGALAFAEREDVRRLASYERGSAGAVMTSDYVSFSPATTVKEAIERLRIEAPKKETIYYAYVVDSSRRLKGFVSLKDLILADPETSIADIMHREIIFGRAADDQENIARMIRKYDLLALPVVDDNGMLTGIVTHDDAVDIIVQEQTEDLEKLMAIQGPHEPGVYLHTSAFEHFQRRVVWIILLAALGLLSGYIVESFGPLLMQLTVLATFMPMLADTGGNTGSQSATLVVRALGLREIQPADVVRVLWKELKVALPLGLVLSALAFVRVFFFADGSTFPHDISPVMVGIAVATALGLQVVTSTLIGALLPIAAARAKLDPAVVASPALTTVVDITGLFLYFMTVKLMLGL